jgi:threonine/homoserine/homoserine lactone efflux protein
MVWESLGDVLPQAVGVALSPMPIIAVILMLTSSGGRVKGAAFALGGWLGLLVAALLLGRASDAATGGTGEESGGRPLIQVALGILFLVLAIRQWRSRPRPGAPEETPGWMATLDKASPLVAFGLGAVAMAVNPKNLSILVAATLALSGAGLTGSAQVLAVALFCLAGAATMLVPVLAALILGEKADPALRATGDWLSAHSAAIMMVLFLVLGAKMLGQGLGGLLGA